MMIKIDKNKNPIFFKISYCFKKRKNNYFSLIKIIIFNFLEINKVKNAIKM